MVLPSRQLISSQNMLPHMLLALEPTYFSEQRGKGEEFLFRNSFLPEDDTNLGWGETFLGKLENLLFDISRAQLEPCRY